MVRSIHLTPLSLILTVLFIVGGGGAAWALPVFPGAVGFGSHTVAGRGGQIYRVTSLSDSGPGSLRHGIEQVQGPRVIIFEVSGVIQLRSDLLVRPASDGEFGFLTIAGQTAPLPGITLKNAGIAVRSHDVLIQHLAIRPGTSNDYPSLPRMANRDAIKIEAPVGHTTYNVVVDHVSCSWASNETASTWSNEGSIHDVAFTHSIFSEAIGPGDPDAHAGDGALVGRNSYRVSFVGNVIALNAGRSISVRDAVLNAEVVNNLVYWPHPTDEAPIAFGSVNPRQPDLALIASAAGNVILRAPATALKGQNGPVSKIAIEIDDAAPTEMSLYRKNNSVFNPDTGTWYPKSGDKSEAEVYRTGRCTPKTWTSDPFPFTHSAPSLESPEARERQLTASMGKHPAFRDGIDEQLFGTIKARTGRWLKGMEELGQNPWSVADVRTTRALEPPANPNADDDNDGYSNLEEWLHGWAAFVEGRTDHPPASIATAATHPNYQSPGVIDGLPTFFQKLQDRVTFPMSWASGNYTDFAAWKKQARDRVRAAWLTPPPPAPWDVTVLAEEDRGGHIMRKLVFNVSGDSRVLAYMTVPKGEGPFPAVLLLHSHGGRLAIGKEKVLRPIGASAEMSAESERLKTQHVAGKLSERGYVTFVTDAINWGDRGGGGNAGQQALASNLMHLGMSFAGLMAWEDLRAADFLAEQPEVDTTRIAAMGLSMGAYRTWQIAAMSDKIAAGVSICWMGTAKSMFSPGMNQTRGDPAYSMLHPGLLADLDYPDIASLAAPKPMLFYNGRYDRLFPQSGGVEDSYAKMRTVWESQGAGGQLVTETWPVEHKFTPEMQEKTFDWLDQVMPKK